jgi:hypothetical protein
MRWENQSARSVPNDNFTPSGQDRKTCVCGVERIPASVLSHVDQAGNVFLTAETDICSDYIGEPKKLVIQRCDEMGSPLIDVGKGIDLVDGSLGDILRVTASTPEMRGQVDGGRISFG